MYTVEILSRDGSTYIYQNAYGVGEQGRYTVVFNGPTRHEIAAAFLTDRVEHYTLKKQG